MYDALRFPDLRRLSRKSPDVNAVKQAFAALNPGLQPNAIAVITNRRQWLEEIRLCLGRDFRSRSCAPEDRGAGDKQPVKIWRGD